MTHIDVELASQPPLWRKAAELAAVNLDVLPRPGQRVAVVGCGTSLYMAQTYAALREASGHGETDAFPASEMPARRYDAVVALSRSGTTTEVVDLLTRLRGTVPTTVLTADPDTPVVDVADRALVLDFADERSVVQTRSATCALVLLRAHLGLDVDALIADGEAALADELPTGSVERTQFTFLGTGWTVGLANEAALKLREAALAWAESYPGMEYRHGPISVSDERSVVWTLGTPPRGLADEVRRTGALWVASDRDPLAEVIRVQRLAVALAGRYGVDPDHPRNLARSIILTA
ncbi:sugar isomerase [Haloechinothrix salitolerans]|uniref:SIS domain-containing protein n=1 Tax=Haloechinothrix salitolerans TaxID=926830 RepID=A0ABW2C2D4_9PSEU